MKLNYENIADYIEDFFNQNLQEKLEVKYINQEYLINLVQEKRELTRVLLYNFNEKSIQKLKEEFNSITYMFEEDFIGTIFFFLSGYWEYINNFSKDKYGRISGKDSFLFQFNLLEEPIVDRLIINFSKKYNLKLRNQKPRYFLTHDIDKLEYKVTIKSLLGDILKRKKIKVFFKNLNVYLFRENPFSVEKLLEKNNKYNIKSNYYFLIGKQDTSSGYEIEEQKKLLTKLNKILEKKKMNIGIHYGFKYFEDGYLNKKVEDFKRIFKNKYLSGRAHYLQFDIKQTFDILEKNNIKLDCTGGYHDMLGFRFGTSYPFNPFNFETEKKYKLLEVPLIFMDSTPFYYMKLDLKIAEDRVLNLLDKIIETNGVLSILWHNSSFFAEEWKEKEVLYDKVLQKISYYKEFDIEEWRNYE